MTGYKVENSVGSPRLHLLNRLIEKGIYSEFEKEGSVQIDNQYGYYFSQELIDKEFDFDNCINGKRSLDFMNLTGYSRPKINNYIEKNGRVVYLSIGYYNIELLKEFLISNMDEFVRNRVETRGRLKK
ncbi:MAG: hypothetical protein PHN31_01790 [Candidatus Gracilibacteria bacterium]|nr:hypothetical protein [Candidatus Gracilibacteria bacterium]